MNEHEPKTKTTKAQPITEPAPVVPTDTPAAVTTPVVSPEISASKLSRLKTAFMYVLIIGLAAAAITSVIALLVGQFTEGIAKALLTIFIFFSHSLLILAVLWADRYNQVGRLLLPTSIVLLVFANIISTTLGTWEIISTESAWRAFSLYFLVLGVVFIIVALLKLRIAHQVTQIAIYTAIGLVVATAIALVPWVLQLIDTFDPVYFRIVSALAILATTSLLIGIIFRVIALGNNDTLKLTVPVKEKTSGGMLAIYISIGVITAIVWCVGFTAFIVSSVRADQPSRNYTDSRNFR